MVVKLIKPTDVIIKQLDKVETEYSTGLSGMRENINSVIRGAEISLKAQAAFGDRNMITKFAHLGVDEQASGYLVLRFKDLTIAGITLARGDQIIKIGQLDVDYYLLHSTGDPAAHIGAGNTFTLVRMFFGDRNPIGD